jgi:beta-mannosidase
VRLRGYSGLKIADAAVLPRKISESQADCLCLFEAVNLTKKSLAIAVAVSFIPLTDRTKRAKTVKPKVFPSRVTLKPGHNAVRLPVLIDEPKLWYPRGMGPQDLYMVRWEFKSGKKILAQGVLRTGLRSVELIQEPQPDGGRSFLFSVNGRSFFAKGANWVPPTMRFADITREHYRRLLELAVRGNIAMLRVWGGGIYEHDSFFDLCDELGILVWQDFMFACGIYPQDDSFCELVRAEGDAVIRRLRNHPSLIAWSGDNENDFAYLWAKRPAGSWLENRLTRKVLKDAAGRLDPTRPYLASSPTTWDPECPDPNDKRSGDCHDYMLSPDPDNQNYYKKFAETSPRFESEFGFVQLPGPDSYRRFNPRGLPLFQKSGDNMADGLFEQGIFVSPEKGMSSDPAVVDRFLLETQFFSAEAFRFVIEHYRRLKGTCNGSLYWKFNDPLADNATLTPSQMSCVDMYLKPKMAYYATARAYHAVLLSFKEEKNGTHSLWCVNDTDRALQRTVVMEKHSFGGEKLFAVSFQADIPADASILLRTFTFGGRNDDSFWRASFREDPATEGWCFALDAAGLCRRALPDPGLSIVSAEPDPSGSMVNVTLKARSFAAAVHLDLSGQEETYYSDNDFFLAPGQVRTVLIESPNFQHRQDDAGPRRLTLSCFNSGAGSPQTRLI